MNVLTATESDVEFARWLGMRWPYKKRTGLFIPPRTLRERAYDEETDQMIAYLRGERRAIEERQQQIANAVERDVARAAKGTAA